MAMKAVFGSVGALWRKAERDAYRAFHAKSKAHKADHFLNFCVTAHSLRDFFLEHQSVYDDAARNAFHDAWNAEPLLIAVSEIANLSKHFQLRRRGTGKLKPLKTRHLVHRRGMVVDVYVTPTGSLVNVPRSAREIMVTTSDGARHELWTFQIDVLDYWRVFLRGHGIRVARQTTEQFIDH